MSASGYNAAPTIPHTSSQRCSDSRHRLKGTTVAYCSAFADLIISSPWILPRHEGMQSPTGIVCRVTAVIQELLAVRVTRTPYAIVRRSESALAPLGLHAARSSVLLAGPAGVTLRYRRCRRVVGWRRVRGGCPVTVDERAPRVPDVPASADQCDCAYGSEDAGRMAETIAAQAHERDAQHDGGN